MEYWNYKGRYFYVIELEDDKNEVMKGYLEIQK